MTKIHLPNIPFVMVRPQFPSQLAFQVPRFLNKIDIKNYMKAVYDIEPLKVSTFVPARKNRFVNVLGIHPDRRAIKWLPMKKFAYLTVKEEDYLEFPKCEMEKVFKEQERRKKLKSQIPDGFVPLNKFDENGRKVGEKPFEKWDELLRQRYPPGCAVKNENIIRGSSGAAEEEKEELILGNKELHPLVRVKGNAKNRLSGRQKLTKSEMRRNKRFNDMKEKSQRAKDEKSLHIKDLMKNLIN